jgi:hypothetical protein
MCLKDKAAAHPEQKKNKADEEDEAPFLFLRLMCLACLSKAGISCREDRFLRYLIVHTHRH